MDEASGRLEELREQAAQVRVRAIETNRALIAELSQLWQEINALAEGRPDVRKLGDELAADIARLEKLDLTFETEWLAEARRVR